MLASENVYKAYKARENHRDENGQPNWVEWAEQNPTANRILMTATLAAQEVEDEREVTDGGDS